MAAAARAWQRRLGWLAPPLLLFAAGCAQFGAALELPARESTVVEAVVVRAESPPPSTSLPAETGVAQGALGAATEATAPGPVPAAIAVEHMARQIGDVVALLPENVPRARLDPDQDAERADLWERMRDGLRIPDLENDLVRKWEQRYAGQSEYLQRMVERGARYLFHIVEEIDKREMPMDLALLPFIESAFNPQALSRASAAGMWQFMPGTGREYELRQNLFRDDRRDVLASTRAALDFLGKLHQRFGDWQLALAAYNWGPGNVARAVTRNKSAGKPTDLSSLQGLPAETRNYVPKLQAMKNIVLKPSAFGIELAKLENHPYFLSVLIERDIDIELAARLAELPLEEFKQLNPQHNRAVILSAGTPHVLLPYDNANRFVRALAERTAPLATWTAWLAPRTLKTAEAAKLVGLSEAKLAEVNHIPPHMLVKVGSTLIVPRGAATMDDVSGRLADTAMLTLSPDGQSGGRQTTLRAGPKGDTVAAVARRHGLAAAQVAQWNRVAQNARFAPGQAIVLILPARSQIVVAAAAAAHAGKPAARIRKPAAASGSGRPKVAVR